MQLVVPSIQYKNSYDTYIKELGSEERYPFPLDFDYSDFHAYLLKVEDFSIGRNLPTGFVQSSTFWITENDEIVGVTNIRHSLNDAIKHCGGHIGLSIRPSARGKGFGKMLMDLSIQFLKELCITEIHIHCHKFNIGSSKTIKACGGVLVSEIKECGHLIERYVVKVN